MSNKVLILAGPTAVGKTELSLQLAKLLNGEIVSADSMQIYRGMDIGTAKASPQEQNQVPHHLLNIRSITEPFHVADFCIEAKKAIDAILTRGRLPIVVGGCGFYLHALIYGPPKGPPKDPSIRQQLEEELALSGIEPLYQRLLKEDPIYANTVTNQDKHKIVRALEIIAISKQPVSNFKREDQPIKDYDFHCFFLSRPRASLYARINARCEQMLEQGLLDEVRALEKQGLRGNRSAAVAIGYRQTLDFLSTPQTSADYARFVDLLKTASRHYAKRQCTWFKREPLFRVVDLDVCSFEEVYYGYTDRV